MSEEIVFADMLNHYSLKTSELSDLLSNTVAYLKKSAVISAKAWQSDASQKFLSQIAGIRQEISTVNSALDELTRIFNTLKNNELDRQIDDLDAVLQITADSTQ